MKYGFVIEGGDARTISEMAEQAEASNWDGAFIADAIDIGFPNAPPFPWFDPWIVLAAMAMRTERIRLGTLITPVSRRRPWKLARETVTLDQLSNGRLIFGVGLGAAEDGGFFKVGEAVDIKVRAELLDEGLAIIAGLWSGKPFSFVGEHYRVQEMTMLPGPVQSPRIPVWVPGVWSKEKSMRRALNWDGIIPQKYKSMSRFTPTEIKALKKYVDENRTANTPFDIIAGGSTSGDRSKDVKKVRPFFKAGATWWLESSFAATPDDLRARIKKGPPRVE